jgi:hypothetical protein
MTETSAKWQQAIRDHFDTKNPDEFIEAINDFLNGDCGDILRQIASELTLHMRQIRNLSEKIEHQTDPQTKTITLYKTVTDGQEQVVNVEKFGNILDDYVVETRQMVDLLFFYAMALSEQTNTD